ncbi:unnamed protein product [Rotaria socialis]
MSSNIIVTNSDEVYILTLHRTFKIKILHLIKDLNDRLDSIIITRTRDITNMVNVKFNTNLTEATVQEIINRLNNGEMNELFHSFDISQLLNHYMTSSVIDTKATLICLKSFTKKRISCEEDLDVIFNQYINIYNLDKIIKGGVYYSKCNRCHQKFYPNYFEKLTNGKRFVTTNCLYNQEYIYFGGKKAYSTQLLINFTSLFLRQYSGFENFENSYNLSLKKYHNLNSNKSAAHEITSEISREYFSNIWFIYQLSLYTFFMNDLREFEIPGLLDNNSIYDFFYINYDQWYNDFVNHWATHHRTHPCAATRKNIDPGYSETSLLTDDDKGIYDDPLMGCNVSRGDRFVGLEKRSSQGIIYTLSPCGIVVGFYEIFRSESCFIALRHLFKSIHVINSQYHQYLPKMIIYDNACSLNIYFWNRYGKSDRNRHIPQTLSSKFISECSFFIDRFHQPNHKRPMCQKERNLDYIHTDEAAKSINTEVAEQRNSVLKQYHNALSSYSSKKARIAYLVLFHLMNCERNTCDNQFEYSRKYVKDTINTTITYFSRLNNDIKKTPTANSETTVVFQPTSYEIKQSHCLYPPEQQHNPTNEKPTKKLIQQNKIKQQ